jgi:hypothetical protein
MANAGTIRPLLFIGCGGSGGKTLRFTHQAIMRRLDQAKWTGGMPKAWQFLWIDVPKSQEGGDEFGSLLPSDDYVGLVNKGTSYASGIDLAVMSMRNCDWMELVGWRPDPAQVHLNIEDGAGQFRALGRMITVRQGGLIAKAISDAFVATTSATAQVEFDQVATCLGYSREPTATAFLVSSLAGGSGAGTFLDVADILAINMNNALDSISAILYTADVFTGDPNISGVEGVEGNSLASLSELLAAGWSEEERSMSIFRSQGMSSGKITRGGIAHPFLVGGTNASGVNLGSATEVYRSVGQSLALIAVSAQVQEKLTKFLGAQWAQDGSGNSDLLGLQDPYAIAPTSSLGYSRIGLGRDRFQEYAVRRLARTAIEFLHTGYLRSGKTTGDGLTPDEAFSSIVDETKLEFLKQCGLHERDEENNQIVEGLKPKSIDGIWAQMNKSVSDKQAGAKESDLATWLSRIQKTAELFYQEFDAGCKKALDDSTKEWAAGASLRLQSTVGDYCARHGVHVTLELLVYTKTELREVAEQLKDEASRLVAKAGTWRGRVGQLGLPATDRIGANHPNMTKLIQSVTSQRYFCGLSEVRLRAASLMTEFAQLVVEPLEAALRAAQADFDSGMVGDNGRPPAFMNWPGDQGVPGYLLPSAVEFLLDDEKKYPETYVDLVVASTTKAETKDGSQPLTIAMQHVIRGGFQAKSTTPTACAVRRDEQIPDWVPTDVDGKGQPLFFIAEFSVDDLFRRAGQWTERPGVFNDHIKESLSDYLSPRNANKELIADHKKRLSLFEAKLGATLSSSSPLIDVDTDLYGITHQKPLEVSRVIEPFPFTQGHPARQIVVDALIANSKREGGGAAPDESAFTSSGAGIGSVGVISYFPKPMHPVVFRSVTKPIDAKLQQGLSKFWQWRRSRRLAEFIPISTSARRAMTRGWFTARILGLLDTEDLKADITILSEKGQAQAFPHVPLGGFIQDDDLPLAAVLESIPLAWIGWSVGRHEAMEPYRRLLRLGLSDPLLLTKNVGDGAPDRGSLYVYANANAELVQWVGSGEAVPNAQPLVSGATPEDRLQSVHDVLDEIGKTLTESFALTGSDSTTLLGAPRGVDLIPEVLLELKRISNAKYNWKKKGGQF